MKQFTKGYLAGHQDLVKVLKKFIDSEDIFKFSEEADLLISRLAKLVLREENLMKQRIPEIENLGNTVKLNILDKENKR